MTSIASKVGTRKCAIYLGGPSAGLALSVLAMSCGTPGRSDSPEETIASAQEALDAGPPCQAPVIVTSNCCPFTLPNSLDPSNPDVYSGSPDADFYRNVRAKMPLFAPHGSPFREDEVFVSQGFTGHGAIDYIRQNITTDASWQVRSLGKGRVITVTYDNDLGPGFGLGNTVIIEYEAPTGEKYRGIYAHLRNGATNDCQEAIRWVDSGGPNVNGGYRNFVNRTCRNVANLDPFIWGTASTTLQVVPGQDVEAGQVIGWAGNTGQGGIQKGLDASGNFTNTFANVHLHLYFMVYTPQFQPQTGSFWSNTDPYGAYATDTDGPTSCYRVGDVVGTHRLFAPFDPTFAGVDARHLEMYLDHYPTMGYMPQTLSVYSTTATQQRAAGSFQPQVRSPETTARVNRSRTDFLNDDTALVGQGLQLREIQVSSFQGSTRYNGIWTRRTGNSPQTRVDIDDTQWAAIQQGEANNGRHPTDAVTYQINGARRHAGVFVGDGVPISSWAAWSNRSLTSFNSLVSQEATFGRKPNSVSAESPADTTYGGVFSKAEGDWVVEPDIGGGNGGLILRNNFHTEQGRRLYRAQGYANGTKFAAIWVRFERPPSAIITSSGATSCGGPSGAPITLDARTSIFDPVFPLGYEWQGPFGTLTGPLQTVNLPVGSNFVQLRAWDGRGLDSLTSALIDITQDVTPPTLTAPSSRTITTCTNANIGTATASDACGAVTIMNNKPAKFPLGNTTVTWTATDQAGNSTTRTQVVTAVLGNDASCCPTGTTLLPGANANANTLNGTSGNDCIIGLGGNDTINGNGGNDAISGGDGNDNINGGSGTDDKCYGGPGTDTISNCETQVL